MLAQGGSNQEISGQLNLSPRTVNNPCAPCFCARASAKKIQISLLVWEGLTNREIGEIVGPAEPVIKSHLCSAFDKLGVWSRLELARYLASHGGKELARFRASRHALKPSRRADEPGVARLWIQSACPEDDAALLSRHFGSQGSSKLCKTFHEGDLAGFH